MRARRESSVALTRRGWSLFGAAIGLVLGGYLLAALEMLALGASALALAGVSMLWLRTRAVPSLELVRRSHPDRLHVGTDGRVDITVTNTGAMPTPVLIATDWFDEGRRAARFLVPPLETGATGRAAYRVPTRRRGRYGVGPLRLALTDPFGIARRGIAGLGVAEVVVRPRIHDLAPPFDPGGSRLAAMHDATAARSLAGDLGDDFLAVREYVVGDDLRRVHWRATARTGDLMIRQHEARWHSRAAVVLDVSANAHDTDSFECAVEATASIVARLVRLRRQVEVATGAGTVLGLGIDPHLHVIDRLATVAPVAGDELVTVLERLRAHRSVDLVVAVIGTLDPARRAALAGGAGASTIVVLTRPGTLEPAPGLTVIDAWRAPFADAWNAQFAHAPAPLISAESSSSAPPVPWPPAPAS